MSNFVKPQLHAQKRFIRRMVAAPLSPWLGAVALAYGSDKRTGHHYLPYYRVHLRSRRWSIRRVLEIGVGGYDDPYAGFDSIRMWRTYFWRATIYGLDINEKVINEPRIIFVRGSQTDIEVLDRIVEMAEGPFDLIIDDGSHINSHVLTTFERLIPHVRSGEMYVIEDLQTAYSEEFGGGHPGADGTSVALIRDLVDGINRAYSPPELLAPSISQSMIAAAHLYANIAFLEKR